MCACKRKLVAWTARIIAAKNECVCVCVCVRARACVRVQVRDVVLAELKEGGQDDRSVQQSDDQGAQAGAGKAHRRRVARLRCTHPFS